ncbi:MAG: Crp/Fnr family transcriptional regulator [Arenicella sp.]|nr:Crp/Fnr family transcriptional regulator [Arenicella sp.]
MKFDRDTVTGVIRRSGWFQGLPEEAIEQLKAKAQVKSYEPGQFLYLVGERQLFVYCVLSGVVRVSVTSIMGQEFVLTDLRPESWMGEISLAEGESRVTEAMVVEAADLLQIPAAVVKQTGDKHPILYKNLFLDHMQRSRSIYELLAGMLFYPLRSRLAGRLLDLAEKHGEANAAGVELDVHMSQLDFARMSMGSRQRINKIFRDWVKLGVVEKQGDKYVIKDIPALQKELELEPG